MAVIEEAFGSHAAFNQVVQEMFGQIGDAPAFTSIQRRQLGSFLLQPVRTLLRATTITNFPGSEEEGEQRGRVTRLLWPWAKSGQGKFTPCKEPTSAPTTSSRGRNDGLPAAIGNVTV